MEGAKVRPCKYMEGFLKNLFEELTGKGVECFEEECKWWNSESCVFFIELKS